jgi:hypothetical protein
MISVDRTEPFVLELQLPIRHVTYHQVMRLARACLESSIFVFLRRQTSAQSNLQPLTNAWLAHRNTQGVLSDEVLQRISDRHIQVPLLTTTVYDDLHDMVGSNTAEALGKWFKEQFRPRPDPVWQWPWALKVLFVERTVGLRVEEVGPLTAAEIKSVRQFSDQYENKKRLICERFQKIEREAKTSGPSTWEGVLLNFPPDEGTLRYFPWLDSVRKCLEYQLIRREWSQLSQKLGRNAMVNLVSWVRRNSSDLPWNPVLPEEPEPLT